MAIFHQWWLWIAFMFLFFGSDSAMAGVTVKGGRHFLGTSRGAWARRRVPVTTSQRSATSIGDGAATWCGWCFLSGRSGPLRDFGGAEVMKVSPAAGKPAEASMLVDVPTRHGLLHRDA